MKLKVTLKVKATGEMLMEKVAMRFPPNGSGNSLESYTSALAGVKAECNREANKAGFALSKCEVLVYFG